MLLNIGPSGTLADFKLVCYDDIDGEASLARKRYRSFGAGQDEAYALKREDAVAYLNGGSPTIDDTYPWVQAEATATGNSAEDTATSILALHATWLAIGPLIEGERIAARARVAACSTLATAIAERTASLAIIAAL